MTRHSLLHALVAGVVLCAGASSAQSSGDGHPIVAPRPPQIGVVKAYPFRSTPVDNHATAAAVVFEKRLHFADASLLQIEFGTCHLPQGGWLEIVSAKDRARELLDAAALAARRGQTAYFNGDALTVRLHAGPTTARNFFSIKTVAVGDPVSQLPETICGPNDDRVRSNDRRVARILLRTSRGLNWCTAFLISPTNCFATAGHCLAISGLRSVTVQFNVPLSTSRGSLVNPGPQDQYLWETATSSRAFRNGGIGNDWGVFRTLKNFVSGKHAGTVQAAFFAFTTSGATDAKTRITGHGARIVPRNLNGVQETHVGPFTGRTGTRLQYRVDTTGGNSGSPVIDEATNKAIGVHTHDGCTLFGGANNGTYQGHAGFAAARKRLCSNKKPGLYTAFGTGCKGSGVRPGGCTVLPKAYAAKFGQTANTFPHARANMRYEQVFLDSEIGGKQTWTELCLRLDERFGGPAETQAIQLYLGGTRFSHLNLGTSFAGNYNLGMGRTLVFSGNLNLPLHSGGGKLGDFKVCMKFSRAVVWPSNANLIVEMVNRSRSSRSHFEDFCQAVSDCTTMRAYAFSASATTATSRFSRQGLVMCLRRLAGTGAIPVLGNAGVPEVGRSFTVTLTRAKARARALLWLGSRTAVRLPGGCILYATNTVLMGANLTSAAGSAARGIFIPAIPALIGVKFANQWWVIDPGGALLGVLALSNGGEGTIGG